MNKKFVKFIISGLVITFVLLVAFAVKAITFKELDEQARTRYQQAKQAYQTEVNAFQNAKRNYLELQTRLKNASEEQKNRLREQILERAREFLKKEISTMIKYLEAMKNKAANARAISEEERTAILNQLNFDISWLQAKQGEIEGATAEQLKQINQLVRERWKNIRVTARRLTGQILAARIKFLIDKAEAMAEKLQSKISELKQQGKDVAKLEELLADFKAKIASAKEKYVQAKAKFQAISGVEGANALLQEGHNLVKEANQYVKQAHQDLVQIVRRIKQLEKPAEPGTATTTP